MHKLNFVKEVPKTSFEDQLRSWRGTYEEFCVDDVLDSMVEAVYQEIVETDCDGKIFRDIERVFHGVPWERDFWERLILRMHEQIKLEKIGPWEVAGEYIDGMNIILRNAEADGRNLHAQLFGYQIQDKRSLVRRKINQLLDLLGIGR